MGKKPSLDTVIRALSDGLDRPQAERLAWVEQFRLQHRQRHDALAWAEQVLLEAMVFPADRSPDGLLDQLALAVDVFEANERPDRAASCWLYLAKWHVIRGDTAEGMACGRRALALPELDLDTRLALTHPMLPGLAELLCFDEAMQCLNRDFLPFMNTAPPSARLAVSWIDAAFLHVVAAMRIGTVQGIFTMDLDDTVAACSDEVRGRMRPALQESRRCLDRAAELGVPAAAYFIAHTRGLVSALEGDCEDALLRFGLEARQGLAEVTRLHNRGWALRVNGRSADALACLQGALQLAVSLGAGEFERASQHELALCLAALGDTRGAFHALSRFNVLHARAWSRSARLSPRLEAPHPGMARAAPSRRTVPPYVTRAQRLFKQTVAQRLSLSEMAARAGTAPRSLQAALNDYLGTTFVSAYRAAAMDEARRLLRLTMLPISEIAGRVGYRSATTFSRDYKAFTGLSPTAFRNASGPGA